jgi:hypothetical protein
VVVLDAKLGTVIRITEELPYFVTALAIAPNGRTVAVATEENSEGNRATLSTQLLASREKDTGSFRVHRVVTTRRVSHVRIAYTHGGRRLKFMVTTAGEEGTTRAQRAVYSWECTSLTLLSRSQGPITISALSPFYNLNIDNAPALAFTEHISLDFDTNVYAYAYLESYPGPRANFSIRCKGQIVFGCTERGAFALNEGGIWGKPSDGPDSKVVYDTKEGEMYKYLWMLSSEPTCLAKVFWSGLPPIHELKGVAWTDKRLTVITDDLLFLSFVEQDYGGITTSGEDKKMPKLTADRKDKITSVRDSAKNIGTSLKEDKEDSHKNVSEAIGNVQKNNKRRKKSSGK